MCSTCIFSQRSLISAERFAELKAAWEAESRIQQCHDSTLAGHETGCRGHYEAYKKGELCNHPIDAIAADMGLGDLSAADKAQVYERLGLIQFLDV